MKYLLDNEETTRLFFQQIDRRHFSEWLGFFADPTSFRYWQATLQSPEIECENWYQKQFSRYERDEGGMNALIEKSTGKLVGHCGLLIQQVDGKQELEIAYSLLGHYRNKGYATEAATKCRDFAFGNRFSSSLISIISLANLPSAAVARKIGMDISAQTLYNNNSVNIFRICVETFARSGAPI